MPIDINGYALANAGGLKFGPTNTKVIGGNYGVSVPTLPGMLGSATAGGPYKVYPFQVNDVNLNIGACWSTSTYRFTAPVAGIYYTSYGGIVGNGNPVAGGQYNGIVVNGSCWYFNYKDSQSTWELQHIEMLLNLAAGDWVSWAFNVAPAPDSGNDWGAYNGNHNHCTIWLVG